MSVRLGNGNWAVSASKLLAYNDAAGPFFNKEFDFTRATTATRINKSGLIELVDNNIARIDFTGSSDGHLLLEPESTNLVTYSEDFSQYSLGSNTTLTFESNVSAPDGSLGVYRLQNPQMSSTFLGLGYINCRNASIFVKAVTEGVNNQFNIYSQNVSVDNQTATTEWKRFSRDFGSVASQNLAINNGADDYASDIYIWGVQAEESSFATSYIPTNGSTVTRNEDTCLDSGTSQDFNSLEGVLYCEIAALVDGDTNRNIAISNGNTNNTVEIFYQSGTNAIKWRLKANTNPGVQYTVTDTDRTEFNKIAFKYKSGDSTMWLNGVKRFTDTDTFNLSGSLSELSFSNGSTGNIFEGKVREVRVYTKALTDAELTTLTT